MKWTEDKINIVKEMLIKGCTYAQIAKEIGGTVKSLGNFLSKHKLKKRELYTSVLTKSCIRCGKKFTVTKANDKRFNHKFCSHSCSAIYNNKLRRKKIKYCYYCNSILNTGSKYCNNTCRIKHTNELQVRQWLNGDITGYVNGCSYKLVSAIREWVFERAKNQCEECTCNKVNPHTGKSILQIDHIDGNAANAAPSNLKVLCPNCHAMTKTWGNTGNRKSARHAYRTKIKGS